MGGRRGRGREGVRWEGGRGREEREGGWEKREEEEKGMGMEGGLEGRWGESGRGNVD